MAANAANWASALGLITFPAGALPAFLRTAAPPIETVLRARRFAAMWSPFDGSVALVTCSGNLLRSTSWLWMVLLGRSVFGSGTVLGLLLQSLVFLDVHRDTGSRCGLRPRGVWGLATGIVGHVRRAHRYASLANPTPTLHLSRLRIFSFHSWHHHSPRSVGALLMASSGHRRSRQVYGCAPMMSPGLLKRQGGVDFIRWCRVPCGG